MASNGSGVAHLGATKLYKPDGSTYSEEEIIGLMPSDYNMYDELGTSGLHRFGNIVYEEFLPALQGDKAVKVYREMSDNDPTVGSLLFAIDMLCREVSWHVEPADSDDESMKRSEFLSSVMDDMSHSWNDAISEALTMLPYGWSWLECVYKKRSGIQNDESGKPSSQFDDGKIGWRKFAGRSQDSLMGWVFDEGGSVQALMQSAAPDYKKRIVPIRKSMLFRTTITKNNPEGKSVLRSAYRPWYFKKRLEEIEAVGIERDLAGLPMAMVDPKIMRKDADADDKQLLAIIKQLVVNVRRDRQEGIIFPMVYDDTGKQLYDFKLLSAGGQRQFDVGKTIQRYAEAIAMTVMADFIFLGHQAVGSFALADNKTMLFSQAIGAWLDVIQAVFNRYAVPRLFALNGMGDGKLPQIKHGDIETPDLAVLADFLVKLSSIGMKVFPDERLESYVREAASLPTKSEETKKLEEQGAEIAQETQEVALRTAKAAADKAEAEAKAAAKSPEMADKQLETLDLSHEQTRQNLEQQAATHATEQAQAQQDAAGGQADDAGKPLPPTQPGDAAAVSHTAMYPDEQASAEAKRPMPGNGSVKKTKVIKKTTARKRPPITKKRATPGTQMADAVATISQSQK